MRIVIALPKEKTVGLDRHRASSQIDHLFPFAERTTSCGETRIPMEEKAEITVT